MPRRKPKDTPALADWNAVDQALKELGEIQRDLELIQISEDECIAHIREDTKTQSRPLIDRRKILEASLEQFAIHHKDDFSKRTRSRKLPFGKVGWRLGTGKFKTLKGWTWTKVSELLDTMGRRDFLRVKKEADKEALEKAYRAGKIDTTWLFNYGLQWQKNDEFYYEAVVPEDPEG